MGLKKLPTRTDDSLGRQKFDKRPATDLDTELQADEYNATADAVLELSRAVGLDDGSTPGSIEERLGAVGARLDDAEACCTETRGHLGEVDARLDDVEACCTETRGRLGEVDARLDDVEACCTETRGRLDVVEPKVTALETVADGLGSAARADVDEFARSELIKVAAYQRGNISIGLDALRGDDGTMVAPYAIAIGEEALKAATHDGGSGNIAIGAWALRSHTQGYSNLAVGSVALSALTQGGANTAFGTGALQELQTGQYNTAVGMDALMNLLEGVDNVAVGEMALYLATTAEQATGLGTGALIYADGLVNITGVGYNAQVTGSNQLQLGDPATNVYAYEPVQSRSDARDKADVVPTELGLDFILGLQPVDFRWDKRDSYRQPPPPFESKEQREAWEQNERGVWRESNKLDNIVPDGTHKRVRKHHGFLAQDVRALVGQMGIDFGGYQDHKVHGGDDVLTLAYTEFVGPLVKAIQEQQTIIEDLKARLEALESSPK